MSKEDFALLTADFIDEFYLKKYIHHLQTLRKKGFRTIEHALNYNSKATAINVRCSFFILGPNKISRQYIDQDYAQGSPLDALLPS